MYVCNAYISAMQKVMSINKIKRVHRSLMPFNSECAR
jgi:hypothetical protein